MLLGGSQPGVVSHLFSKLAALALVAAGYVASLGVLAALVCRATRRWAGAYATGATVLASAVGVLASPFVVLALILTGRYVIQGVCSVEALSCSETIEDVYHALWIQATYPHPEQLLGAVALFVALITLAVWQGRRAGAE